ncbi:hypothetical protein Poly21_28580 [Allorhodopirellula heiligendammensis]|uniref:Uncharacterized protein n=1 Tax=Allorhodopirellula heiligendammensis TaxID=2714739 RepID=A0A5C6BW41_9BACT|nr:hypothetical protein Poly21_28580 [Allorhodopirellula heiligendammensis]
MAWREDDGFGLEWVHAANRRNSQINRHLSYFWRRETPEAHWLVAIEIHFSRALAPRFAPLTPTKSASAGIVA